MDELLEIYNRINEKNLENLSQIRNGLIELLKRHYNDGIDTAELCKPFKEFRLNEIYKLQQERIELLKRIKSKKLTKEETAIVNRIINEVKEYEGGYSLKDKAKTTRDITNLLKSYTMRENSVDTTGTKLTFQESPSYLKLPAVNAGSIDTYRDKCSSIDYSNVVRPGISATPQMPTSKPLQAIPSLAQMQATDTIPYPKLPTMSKVKSQPHHSSCIYQNENARRIPYPSLDIEKSKVPMNHSPIPPIPNNTFPHIVHRD